MLEKFNNRLLGLMILLSIILIGINIIFSYSYFNRFNINTTTLDLLNNTTTYNEARKTNINGYFLTPNEINHLQDVIALVIQSRIALIIILSCLIIILFKRRSSLTKSIHWAWLWLTILSLPLSIAYYIGGSKLVSSYLHSMFFPQGNWKFASDSLIRQIYSVHTMEHGAIFITSFTVICMAIITLINYYFCKRIKKVAA